MSPSRRMARARNITDLRLLAQRALPAPMREYLDRGSDEEATLARNT